MVPPPAGGRVGVGVSGIGGAGRVSAGPGGGRVGTRPSGTVGDGGGAGVVASGAGVVASGAGVVASGAGVVGSGTGVVGSAAGVVGSAAGVVGSAAGVVADKVAVSTGVSTVVVNIAVGVNVWTGDVLSNSRLASESVFDPAIARVARMVMIVTSASKAPSREKRLLS